MAAKKKAATAADKLDVTQDGDVPMGHIHVLRSGKVVTNPADNWLGCWGDFLNAIERGKADLAGDKDLEIALVKG